MIWDDWTPFPVCQSVRKKQVLITVITLRSLLCGTTTPCLQWFRLVLVCPRVTESLVASCLALRGPDCLFLLLQQTSQGICHGCLASSNCFSTVESCRVLFTLQLWKHANAKPNQTCWHQPLSTTATRTVQILREDQLLSLWGFKLNAKRQLNLFGVECFLRPLLSLQVFRRPAISAISEQLRQNSCSRPTVSSCCGFMISHKIG